MISLCSPSFCRLCFVLMTQTILAVLVWKSLNQYPAIFHSLSASLYWTKMSKLTLLFLLRREGLGGGNEFFKRVGMRQHTMLLSLQGLIQRGTLGSPSPRNLAIKKCIGDHYCEKKFFDPPPAPRKK